MQILCVIMIVTVGVLDISQAISLFYDFRTLLVFIPYYVSDFAGFMSEHQFVAFMHVLKRTVQNWNNHIDGVSENDDVINSPLNGMLMNGQKSVLFTVSNTTLNSNREKMHSKLVHFNTFAASYLSTQGLNNSCLKSPGSTLVHLTFQSRALRFFTLNQLRNLSL